MGNDVLHRAAITAGSFSGMVPAATCGAKRADGAKFTTLQRKVTCPACIAKVTAARAAAKARFAALEVG